jgi:Domain of unknown function (DUF4365)
MVKLPQRPQNHNREELSERFFNSCLPGNWYSHKPQNDYGIDLIVDLFDGSDATGLELLVQLKSTGNPNDSAIEKQGLDTSTYNYLKRKLQVVMIVKYVIPDDEAYWILLKDVPSPNQRNKSLTIHIPKENRLSEINWDNIKEYVRGVTDRKLAAQMAYVQIERNSK